MSCFSFDFLQPLFSLNIGLDPVHGVLEVSLGLHIESVAMVGIDGHQGLVIINLTGRLEGPEEDVEHLKSLVLIVEGDQIVQAIDKGRGQQRQRNLKGRTERIVKPISVLKHEMMVSMVVK